MRIPYSISRTIFRTYRCSAETQLLPREQRRTIKPEDDKWDESIPPDLKTLALRVIAQNWLNNPLFEELPTCDDKDVLYEILPTDLPFEFLISKIPDGYYWERAAKDRWEFNDIEEHNRSWRQLYSQRHVAEYLMNLEPTFFASCQEECKNLLSLSKNYIHVLKLKYLKPTIKMPQWMQEEQRLRGEELEDCVEHIPMSLILPQLPLLTELYLSFGMIYLDDGFEWRDFQFSINDCVKLGKALASCPLVKKFSLTRSNLDQPRAAGLLQGLVKMKNLEELDFSNCKLGDAGTHAVAEFLSLYQNLKILHLCDNNIGHHGIAGIVFVLTERQVVLKHLNLRMNPLRNDGGGHICALLLRNRSIEVLNISACELDPEIGEGLADVFESCGKKTDIHSMNISSNNFGPEVGKKFEKYVKTNKNLIEFEVRLCNFTPESESVIYQTIIKYKQRRARHRSIMSHRSTLSELSGYSMTKRSKQIKDQEQPVLGPTVKIADEREEEEQDND